MGEGTQRRLQLLGTSTTSKDQKSKDLRGFTQQTHSKPIDKYKKTSKNREKYQINDGETSDQTVNKELIEMKS